MTKVLINKLSEIRETMINNKQKETTMTINRYDIGMIITALKMSNAFDEVIDEELAIKYNRGMLDNLNKER